MESGAERFGRDRLVQVVGDGDQRGVEVAGSERGGERRVRGRAGAVGDAVRVRLVGVDRGRDRDGHPGALDRVEVPVRDRAAADHRHPQVHDSTITGKRSK